MPQEASLHTSISWLNSKQCRCCGALGTFKKYQSRPITPFFRIFGLHIVVPGEPLKQVEIEYGGCDRCYMIAPWPCISDDSLVDYYNCYCTELYKSERARLEPEYARIADLHFSAEEIDLRRSQHEEYILPILRERTSRRRRIRLLDYGGGSGGLAPRSEWIDSDIYEVGDRERRPAYRAFNFSNNCSVAPLCTEYDFVQLMHVLEHVGNPLATLRKACRLLRDGGLIYVEVPFEMTDFNTICNSKDPWCDEHINKFCQESVMKMMDAAGLHCLDCQSSHIRLLHITEPLKIIRCLAVKPYKGKFSRLLNEMWRVVIGSHGRVRATSRKSKEQRMAHNGRFKGVLSAEQNSFLGRGGFAPRQPG